MEKKKNANTLWFSTDTQNWGPKRENEKFDRFVEKGKVTMPFFELKRLNKERRTHAKIKGGKRKSKTQSKRGNEKGGNSQEKGRGKNKEGGLSHLEEKATVLLQVEKKGGNQ